MNLIVGFSKAKGAMPLSSFIMVVEGTPFSHTYLKIDNQMFGDHDIYQASKGMVNHVTDVVFEEHNIIVEEYEIPIPCEKRKEILKFLRARLGKPYSFRTLLGIFIIEQLHKIGIRWKKLDGMFDGEKAYICSELVARVLKSCDIIEIDFDVDKATPKQLREVLHSQLHNKYTLDVKSSIK